MANEQKNIPNPDADTWISREEAARMLGLNPSYVGECIRTGFLRGKIGYRSYTGRNYTYNLADVKRVLEQATVPAKRT